jgi:hypothetical protein
LIAPTTRAAVFELRQYTLHPGRRDELIALFEREFIEPQEAAGAHLFGLFRDLDSCDRFVWVRGFSDMNARERALRTFYGGPVWREHRDAANATMIDSDNVLLLRPAQPASGLNPHPQHLPLAPLLCATYSLSNAAALDAFAREFANLRKTQLERDGATVLASLVTEPSKNTFPALPVREGEHTFVLFVHGITGEQLTAHITHDAEIVRLAPTSRSIIQ